MACWVVLKRAGRENVRGFIELEVGRKRFAKSGGRLGPPDEHVEVGYFHRVGVLIVGKIGTEISTLFVRSAKPTLRKFFEDLVPVVAEYATLTGLLSARWQNLRCRLTVPASRCCWTTIMPTIRQGAM